MRRTARTWIRRAAASLFELKAGNFYIALAGERDRRQVLRIIRKYRKPDQRIFTASLLPRPSIETAEEVRDGCSKPATTYRSSNWARPTMRVLAVQ